MTKDNRCTAEQFIDALDTLRICALINQDDKPNKKLRHCCKKLTKRLSDPTVIAIITSVLRAKFPLGRLMQLEREFCNELDK